MNFYETVNLTYIFLGVSNVLNGLTYIFMLLHVCSEIRASNSLRHRGIFEISAHNCSSNIGVCRVSSLFCCD